MRALTGLAKAAGLVVLFLLFIGFGLKNSDPVIVRFYLGHEWRSALSLVLLVFFGAGVVLGVAASLGMAYRQRRELAQLRRRTQTDLQAQVQPRQPPVPETPIP